MVQSKSIKNRADTPCFVENLFPPKLSIDLKYRVLICFIDSLNSAKYVLIRSKYVVTTYVFPRVTLSMFWHIDLFHFRSSLVEAQLECV